MEHELYSDPGERSERAGSFARVAEEYERGRPGYPPEAIRWLLGDEPLRVLDLGAGTGKLTAALLAAGHHVIAVEPLEPMRAILAHRLPNADTLAGSAEQLPLDNESVDAVAVGSAFHWFEREAALAEIQRVLRTPGIFGLLGNGFDTGAAWVARVREILGPPAIQRPGHWPAPEELRGLFGAVDEREFPHRQQLDRGSLRDLASSRSSLAMMTAEQRQTVLGELDRLWDQQHELRGHAVVQMPWCARVRRCRQLLGTGVER